MATRGGRKKARPQPNAPTHDVHVADGIRLQKVMADAGVGSRRHCELIIEQGRVEVDGVLVLELGVRVDPEVNVVHVDGMRIQADQTKVTIAVNKPTGMVSTMSDPQDRPTIAELVQGRTERLFHIGRLDYASEGLLLLTNDGELANRLQHPKYEVPKVYLVTVEGRIANGLGSRMLKGIELEDGLGSFDKFKLVDQSAGESLIEVELHSGKNRIVRRMFDEVGHPVVRLVRTAIGPIRLGDLKQGRTRILGKTELGTLMSRVEM